MRPAAALLVALCTICAAAVSADERAVACALPAPSVPPDPTRCARLIDDAALPAGGDRIEAWIARARREAALARHDLAEAALDCAVAASPPSPDAALKRRLLRARGGLDYARERMPEALEHLQCALAISSAGDDREAEAADLNALGSALRRLGDYRGALATLTESLEMRRATGGETGAVLNNIADVYRELGDRVEAMRHYREALAAFRDADDSAHAAHVLESMAVVVLEDGDPAEARRRLEEALASYRAERRRDFELRVHGWLVRAALAEGDIDAARRWSAAGQALALEHRLAAPASFTLQAARTERLSGAAVAAVARLRAALAPGAQAVQGASGEERAELYAELAAAQEAAGDAAGAIASLRRAREEADAFSRATHDRQLGWLRTRFETAERDRTIARLQIDNRMRRLQLALALALAAAAMLGGWLWLQRRRQREREAEAARLARKEEELARYRREAAALAEDRLWPQALLDSREQALCLLDADGVVLAANRAACQLLGQAEGTLAGHALADRVLPEHAATVRAALERMEDAAGDAFVLADGDGGALRVRLSPWSDGNGLIVVALEVVALDVVAREVAAREVVAREVAGRAVDAPDGGAIEQDASEQVASDRGRTAQAADGDGQGPRFVADPPQADAAAEAQQDNGADAEGRAPALVAREIGAQTSGDAVFAGLSAGHAADAQPEHRRRTTDLLAGAHPRREAFRRALVELMLSTVDIWERGTGSGRLELAGKSRIWRVAVDDGRVRARAMERYLSLARLPQNPRWRDVVRTGYYVLEHCPMDAAARERLQSLVDAVLAHTRRSALL